VLGAVGSSSVGLKLGHAATRRERMTKLAAVPFLIIAANGAATVINMGSSG
jgi:hypothetical protein